MAGVSGLSGYLVVEGQALPLKVLRRGEHKVIEVALPMGTDITLSITGEGGEKKGASIKFNTPAAAELIVLIARHPYFAASRREKKMLERLGLQISGRYSGHPKV